MDKKSKAGDSLRTFTNDIGVPENLTLDGSKEQTVKNTEFLKQVCKHDINHHVAEPERKNQSHGEGVIRELIRKWFRTMVRKIVPRRFWDYGIWWVAEIMSLTSTHTGGLNGRCLLEGITGKTAGISEYLDFGFYD